MKRQRLLLIFLSLVLPLALLSGCWHDNTITPEGEDLQQIQPAASSEPEKQVSLPTAFSLPYDPSQTLDPITCPDGGHQTLVPLLYEGLYELDQSLTPQPKLCRAASYDPATLTWSLTLREGVSFTDGSPLSGADVAATLKRAMASLRYGSRLSGVKSVSASGSTVFIALSRANANLPSLLDIPIVKAGTQDNPVPTGTGPYAFISDETGNHLLANGNWWGGSGQPVSRITLVGYQGENAMLYKFSAHDVQLIAADLTGAAPVSVTGNVDFYDADTTVLQYVGFNMRKKIFASAALRSALNQGLDRANITSAYLSGHAKAAQFPLSPLSPAYPADLEQEYSYTNYESAMTAAGYHTGASYQLTMIVNEESSFKVSAARQIAAALSAFDLSVQVTPLPWADYMAALHAGRYDLYYGEVRLTADWNLAPLLATGGSLNYGGFSDATLDGLIAQYGASGDQAAAMKSLCAYLQQQTPILPVCFKCSSVLSQAGVVENLTPTAANPFYDLSGCTIHLAKTDG